MLVFSAMNELKSRTVNLHNLPEIRIEDLLGRDEININLKKIAGELKGKVTLVTGAAGSIGSELCRQLCKLGLKQLILFDSAETPMHTLRLELEDRYPEVVFTRLWEMSGCWLEWKVFLNDSILSMFFMRQPINMFP